MDGHLSSVVVVMGVSGSGKTTVGALLAGRLGWPFADGDDFHPPANVEKMHAGIPLTDEDRWPWLRAIAAWIDERRAAGEHGVVACSALRRSYREVLRGGRPDVRLVYLKGDKALISRRQAARHGHFMPTSLMDSQFATLEEPGSDEAAIIVSVEPRPQQIVEAVLGALGPVEPEAAAGGAATDRDALKRRAAEAAVAEVEDGMVLGLGSGSTAEQVLHALAARVASGLRVSGVPTSERTAALARRLGVKLTDFAAQARLDLTIDGADEVEPSSLALVKGRGGALLREKIVAAASRRMLVVVDDSKLVPRLGRGPVPVEIVAFGWQATLARLAEAGMRAALRRGPDGAPFVTDSGNHIADCSPGPIEDAAALDRRLRAVVGVVETGLFLGLAWRVAVAGAEGIRWLDRP